MLKVKIGDTLREATKDEVLAAAAQYWIADKLGEEVSPENAPEILRRVIGAYDREHAVFAFLDNHYRLLAVEAMFSGSLAEVPQFFRPIAKRAFELNARYIVAGHNHPSGNLQPSEADGRAAWALFQALTPIEVELLAAFVLTKEGHAPIDLAKPGQDLLEQLFQRS